ncbi:hypothetical protein [Streptomyces sp. WMMB 322]|uniref:hypothetical protein n=1 Tax=Streptomyces sp. WMMB 322 TaxID=1286821 RepID=UPI000823BBEC|nr:hypothetical protein [Streptomyces sp. WMMB 322]SCK40140.1 hypothetical protein H180DRAFT_03452 [Streptomyces sp. WMMB 322]
MEDTRPADRTTAIPDVPTAPPRPGSGRLWLTAAVIAGATALVAYGLSALRPSLPSVLPDYGDWIGGYYRIGSFLRWIVADGTESEYAKTELSGLGMILGAWLAHCIQQRRKGGRWQGFAISYGTGLWPWGAGSAAMGMIASNLAWGWTVPATGAWQPTFAPFVSVPPAVVLVYGAGWAVSLTGAALGVLLTTPVALLAVNYVCVPLGLPGVVGATTGMWASALIGFAVCRVLPWMPRPLAAEEPRPEREPEEPRPEREKDSPAPAAEHAGERQGPVWVARRVLADFSEAQFYGNEWASVGLLLGTLFAFLLNPMLPAAGGLWPQVLASQVLTGAVAVVLWRSGWSKAGWYPSFVPVVSVAPATVLAYGGSVQSVVVGAVFGAVAAPPLAAAIGNRMPAHFHPFIGNVVSMTVCCATFVPLLALLPGFTTS